MRMEQHKEPQKETNNQESGKNGSQQEQDKSHPPGQGAPDQPKK
jgi:hypothetical protein